MHYYIPIIVYIVLISVIAVFITAKDKLCAIKRKRRVSEKCLFIIAILGGGIAMYITVVTISHKTRHKIFMIGVPIIVTIEAMALITVYNLVM